MFGGRHILVQPYKGDTENEAGIVFLISVDKPTLQDTVTFTIPNNAEAVTKSSFPKSEVADDILVEKAKANQEK